MATTEYPQIAELSTISPEEMTAEQRATLISCLSAYDSEQFIKKQGQTACAAISDIKKHQDEFDKKGEKFAESQFSAYMKKHPNQKFDAKTISRFANIAEKKSDFYRKKYACQLLGLGNNALNYCIGLQRQACLNANADLGYDIMPDIGLSCANACTTFKAQKVGQYHAKISDCYNLSNQCVKYNQNGEPKLKNGDLLLVVDPKDNQAYHCVRLNVDQQGKVTYTSGNGEAISDKLTWMSDKACYIIPTQEITQKNAQKHYECMSNEKLLEMAQAKGMFANQTPVMQTTNTAAQTNKKSPETADIYTIMRSDFNRFKNYIQRMSELQNPEKTVVAQTTNSVSKATPYHRFVRPQSQYG